MALVLVVVSMGCSDSGAGDDGRPESARDLAGICEDHSDGHDGAAPYSDAGPHPLVLFSSDHHFPTRGTSYFTTAGPGEPHPPARDVQLVACSYRTGRVSAEPIMTCSFTERRPDGDRVLEVDYYQGSYRVDIYQARTRRRVGSLTVTGPPAIECPFSEWSDDITDGEEDTYPAERDYAAVLEDFVTGVAGATGVRRSARVEAS